MRVSKATSARHRAALLAAASRLFREKGFDKVGIAEIAAAARLTHGAFYTHFESKEALCAEAVEQTIRHSLDQLRGTRERRGYLEAFLSAKHVRNRADGCPFTALCGDAVRETPAIRAAFARGLDRYIGVLAGADGEATRSPAAARRRAIVEAATLVGGLLLARTAGDATLRDEILSALRATLIADQV